MNASVQKKMQAQLRFWSLRIDKLVARTEMSGIRAGFEAHMYIDELKALHAIAQAKLDELGADAGDTRQAHLEAEMKVAWDELDAALRNPNPSR